MAAGGRAGARLRACAALPSPSPPPLPARPTPPPLFLQRLGIDDRADRLARNLTGAALESHRAAHRRLTHPQEMGSLFKVLALTRAGSPLPPGFAA
mgnify:CR=1 FL=1